MLQHLKYLTTVLLKPETVSYSPVHIQLEPTNYCNLKCKMCIRDNARVDNKNMSLEEYKEIIGQIKPKKVTFAGTGEPTIAKDLPGMIKYSADKNISTMISTNMTLFENGKAENLVSSGLKTAKISIDAATPETYLKIRGEDCFEKIIQGIENITRAKKELKTGNPELRFDYVILRDNIDEMPEVIKLAARLEIKTVYFRPLQKVGLKEETQKALTENFDSKKMFSALKETQKAAKKLNISSNINEIINNVETRLIASLQNPSIVQNKKKVCLLPWLQTFVAANGDVSPCCALYFNGKLNLGNIFETGFEKIWNGESYRKVRNNFKKHRVFDVCKDCNPRDMGTLLSMAKFAPGLFK